MPASPKLFDRNVIRRNRRRALGLGAVTFLLDRVVEDLTDRLSLVTRRFDLAADVGTPTDALSRALLQTKQISRIVCLRDGSEGLDLSVPGATADLEMLPLKDETFDLLVSALALQFVNDLPGTLVQVRRALKPDGLFLAALLGGATLTELRAAFAAAEAEIDQGISPRVAPFADVRSAGMLLQRAGFALPVTDAEALTVRYETPFALMQDLRRMGGANPLLERRRAPLRRSTLMRMAEIYRDRFADPDGRLRATFEIIWLSGWKPHASQQQPLRPGSARVRLADTLGTKEISAGEKSGSE
jgi:SAM-dependent methyltransferase